ncbi:MAG: hypothetical protein GPJ54_10430 [Candidatus Heimdallarchaeota archaeon]|nr:hypothetical protein [Candidatus Heimdallarchaeota archaeon]
MNKLSFRERVLLVDPSIEHVPMGYKRLENKIILRHKTLLKENLGLAVLKSYPWCTSVFQHINTLGENRRPELRHLAGDENTIVTHTENKTKYVLDISKITFSGGNRELRKRLVDEVSDGENVLDMFAAVGNLSMQVLKHRNVNGILVERDDYTFSFLNKSIILNKLTNVDIHNLDCRDIEITNWANRIFMGYHNVAESHLKRALDASKELVKIHIHPLALKNDYSEFSSIYHTWIRNYGARIIDTEVRKIKSYSPNLDHIEIVVSIEK